MEGDGEASPEVQTVSSEDVPRTPNPELKKLLFFKVYKRRWFVLLVLCLLNCSNAMVSNEFTFTPGYLTVNDEAKLNDTEGIYCVVSVVFFLLGIKPGAHCTCRKHTPVRELGTALQLPSLGCETQ